MSLAKAAFSYSLSGISPSNLDPNLLGPFAAGRFSGLSGVVEKATFVSFTNNYSWLQ
jgi:hypothetical protein